MSEPRIKVLCIDDESRILRALKALFRDMDVHTTTDPKEAIRWAAEHDIDVIVCDQRMPKMQGIEVLREIRIAHPRGPALMEVWSWCLVDRAAPPEVKDAMRRCYQPLLGPSGLLEQDDGENWERASQGAAIAASWDHPFNYEMGLGHEFSHEW